MAKANQKPLQIRENTIIDSVIAKSILKLIFKCIFKLSGWTAGPAPQYSGVAIGAPHTSNWDFIYGIGASVILDLKVYFSIKQSWCRIPVIGSLFMYLGAIPIDRSTPGQGQVEQITNFVQQMNNRQIYFAFTPEGTRSKVEKWKTGFYHVAQDCQLPIHLAKLDYVNKVASIFHTFTVTGDKDADISTIQEAYKLIKGRNLEKQFPEYSGRVPEISSSESDIMRKIYLQRENMTLPQISQALQAHDTVSVDNLLAKGLLEKLINDGVDSYYLTVAGRGCLLHFFSRLD